MHSLGGLFVNEMQSKLNRSETTLYPHIIIIGPR